MLIISIFKDEESKLIKENSLFKEDILKLKEYISLLKNEKRVMKEK